LLLLFAAPACHPLDAVSACCRIERGFGGGHCGIEGVSVEKVMGLRGFSGGNHGIEGVSMEEIRTELL
jgi:hypothetical protein